MNPYLCANGRTEVGYRTLATCQWCLQMLFKGIVTENEVIVSMIKSEYLKVKKQGKDSPEMVASKSIASQK